MNIESIIASEILSHWGYHNVTVGDLDHRNYTADKQWSKDKTYKTNEAVKHAYRLADIALRCIKGKVK